MVTIVDYGVGNLSSIRNMFKKLGVESKFATSEQEIFGAEKLILPGVGAFDSCAEKLKESGLINALRNKALDQKTPLLGICVGMQMLMQWSEEGKMPGLGWIPGKVVKFDPEKMHGEKIPHMGWTPVELAKPSALLQPMDEAPRFYFVHSYHAVAEEISDVSLYADYGYRFVAGIERENILGVQFHPEKSHRFGMTLLKNFVSNF